MNDIWAKILISAVFILTYVGLLVFSKKRAYIALAAALLVTIIQIFHLYNDTNLGDAFATAFKNSFNAIEWNVLMMLIGIMGIVALFIESRMPAFLGDVLVTKSGSLRWAIVLMAIFAGVVSAFVDNVATVIMLAPIGVTLAKRAKVSPVPILIAIAISSNLEGAATLIGDTSSILLAQATDMNFADFFIFQGKPGLFFIIQVGMIATSVFLFFFFRKFNQPIKCDEKEKVNDFVPTILLFLALVLLVIFSFISNKPALTNGFICLGVLGIGIAYHLIKTRDLKKVLPILGGIDFTTIFLLLGLFVVIGSLQNVGLIDDLASLFTNMSNNPLIIYTAIVLVSVIISGFVDNIPYIMTMLPVITEMSKSMSANPYLFYFGLVVGATLGGNLTPIGASANITAIGILRKEGYEVKLGSYMKLSIPFTLIAVTTGYLLVLAFFY